MKIKGRIERAIKMQIPEYKGVEAEIEISKVWVFRRRLKIYANGILGKNSGLIAYAWFIWDKEYNELPKIDWI